MYVVEQKLGRMNSEILNLIQVSIVTATVLMVNL